MNFIHTQGVVLRYTNINESDRMLTVFSPEHGKLGVLSRGCRKQKSKFLPVSQLFCYGEFELRPYRDIYILLQAEVKDAYFDIRNDMERLAYASYITNLTEETITTGEGNNPLFALLLQGLAYLSYSEIKPNDAALIYELKLLELAGYRPVTERCVICGGPISGNMTFDPASGGVVCVRCGSPDHAFPINDDTVNAMNRIIDTDMSRLESPDIVKDIRKQLNTIIPAYIEEKFDKKFKSRDFAQSFFIPIA